MKSFGLIGKKLTHSFSKKYFEDKFKKENLKNHNYELFELETIDAFKGLISDNPLINGLNVTIPYKQIIIAMGSGATASLGAFDYLIRHSEATAEQAA